MSFVLRVFKGAGHFPYRAADFVGLAEASKFVLGDKKQLRDAVAATNLSTVVGPVKWGGGGPFKNVSKTPLVLGQWVKGKKHRYELVIVSNHAAPEIPVAGKLKLIS